MAKVPVGNLVEDESSAIAFAEDLLSASLIHLSSSSTTGKISNNNNGDDDGSVVEWKEFAKVVGQGGASEVSIEATSATGPRGPFQSSLMRVSIPLGGISAKDMYNFLISKEGYLFLDPDADPSDFGKPLLGPFTFPGDGGTMQVEYASLALPFPLANRDYVVLNAFANKARTFLSASCYSPDISKEASPYDDAPNGTATTSCCGKVRFGIYGAYSVEEGDDTSSCVLKVAQYVDMNGWISAAINDQANLTWFKSLVDRAQKRHPVREPNNEGSKKVD